MANRDVLGRQSRKSRWPTFGGLAEVVVAISAVAAGATAPFVGGVEARNLAVVSVVQFSVLALGVRRRRLERRTRR